jgi:hypothetical protein
MTLITPCAVNKLDLGDGVYKYLHEERGTRHGNRLRMLNVESREQQDSCRPICYKNKLKNNYRMQRM